MTRAPEKQHRMGLWPALLVPLAGLEPATCCLGDNCQSSGLYGSVGSSQVRLGGVSGECGLVRFSYGLWNDRENDQLGKQVGSRPICGERSRTPLIGRGEKLAALQRHYRQAFTEHAAWLS